MMPAYIPGTAPAATPDQIVLLLGRDVRLMDLSPHANDAALQSGFARVIHDAGNAAV